MVTSDGQTEIQSFQIVTEIDEAEFSGSGQYILLNDNEDNITVQMVEGEKSDIPGSLEGTTILSSDRLVSFYNCHTVISDQRWAQIHD